jgi:hypothetical protein
MSDKNELGHDSDLRDLLSEAATTRQQEDAERQAQAEYRSRLAEQQARRSRMVEALSNTARSETEGLLAAGAVAREDADAMDKLRRAAAADAGLPLRFACKVLLLAADGDTGAVAAALEGSRGERGLRRWPRWLLYVLENLWPPDGCPAAEVPDGTSLDEKRRADAAFGWGSLVPFADPAPNAPEEVQGAGPLTANYATGREEALTVRIVLVPGGFELDGKHQQLTGRPLEMLRAILNARHYTETAENLRRALGIDDEFVELPDQVIKDTASDLRRALRSASRNSSHPLPANPFPSNGRGPHLVYRLDLGESK